MRPDRDLYVTLVPENIKEKMMPNFAKYSTNEINSRDSPYDYKSLMHYNSYAFSTNGNPTLVRASDNVTRIGAQREGMSMYDRKQLNDMYGCTPSAEALCSDTI